MLRSGYLALAAGALSVVLSACGSDSADDLVAGTVSLTAVEDTPVRASLDFTGGTTATVVTAPTKGDVVFSGSPLVLTYTPHPNENGVDTFTYQVSNGDKTSNLGSVTVGINAVDDPPSIVPTLAVDEDGSVTATLINDVDGQFISQIVTAPSFGTLTADSADPGKFTYKPNADFNGGDSVTLSASYLGGDGTAQTITGTVAITVRPTNDPPAGVADSVHTVQGLAARFEPLANDRDVDGDALAVRITSAPSVGTATVNADGSIQYTPSSSFVGNTSLEYEVRDAGGLTARATMSIDVGLTSGILYLSRPDVYTPNELYFSDGARSFKVNAPLPAGESIYSVAAAKSAPLVFYQTQQNGSLYRVDLRQPGVAQQVDPAAPDTAQELAGVDLNPVASSSVSQDKSGATAKLLAADGSFAVVVARDLQVLNLRDTSQLIDITNGMIAEKPTLIPNF
jgi:VCBS repeat-containing protein